MSAEPFSEAWWETEAFDGAPRAFSFERRAARAVCETYGIRGLADPSYIANVLADRYAPSGPNPIEPGLESACRFLIAVYPALAEVAHADLAATITAAFERVEP